MKFDNLQELKVCDKISQPILIINNKNLIIYANLHSENFLKIINNSSFIGKDINEVIILKNEYGSKMSYIDFYDYEFDEIEVAAEIDIYKLEKIKINIINIQIENNFCKMLLVSSTQVKKNFFQLEDKQKKNKENIETIQNKNHYVNFNYMNIKDLLNDYHGERINQDLATGIIQGTTTAIVVEKDNNIIFYNNATLNIFGVGIEEANSFIGKKLNQVVNFMPMCCNDKYIDEQYKMYSKSNMSYKQIIKRDGTGIFCEVTTMFLEENHEKYHIYLFKDITNKVKMEMSLVSNKNTYMRLLELIPIGVMIHTNNRFNSANNAQQKIFGVENINNLTNIDIINMVHEDSKGIYKEMYYNAYNKGKTTEIKELKIRKKCGKIIEVEMVMMAMDYEGERSIVILTEEITDRKRAKIDKLRLEETLKYDKLKTEFISNVSHELKTPLNIILSTVQLLQHSYENYGDEQLNRYLTLTKTNSYRLLRLINNLIDGTRIDVGNLKMNFENYNIVKIVEDITMEAVEYVEDKGLTITFDTNVEEKIIGVDKDNVERIILNLLSNAVKFSKKNGKIYVRIIDKGDLVKIIVVDDGKGISKENQKKIFEKFVQADNLFTRTAEGSGVGLSLVKSIVLNHGGNIQVKSELGRGSKFIVELPNILSKKTKGDNSHTINQVTSKEKVKIEFSDI